MTTFLSVSALGPEISGSRMLIHTFTHSIWGSFACVQGVFFIHIPTL
uniref:Uncharacterized protein n=1 Tax=Anguilla anguilla TaxID=7936 RepID=A0A0E9T8E8_ANGAN